MEHIIQFGVTIDDKKIEEAIYANAQRIIIDEMKKNVQEAFFEIDHSYYGRSRVTGLSSAMQSRLDDLFDEHRDQIIELAAEKLAVKLSRTKAVKEAAVAVAKEGKV